MRLTPAQINTIKSTATAVLGERAQVWLYGSRLDDERRGGDVDMLVESERKPSGMDRARFKYQLENALQLPVDVLMVQTVPKATTHRPQGWAPTKNNPLKVIQYF
jgi:predicted nucleotidyltransferase